MRIVGYLWAAATALLGGWMWFDGAHVAASFALASSVFALIRAIRNETIEERNQ